MEIILFTSVCEFKFSVTMRVGSKELMVPELLPSIAIDSSSAVLFSGKY